VLRGYARLQADLAPHAADLLSLGLADLRPGSVPGQFEKLLGNPHIEAVVGTPDGITRSQHERLRGLGPQLREVCAELDDLGIPVSLDHADGHPGNIFAASGSPFDWGDAAVAHPFSGVDTGEIAYLTVASSPDGLCLDRSVMSGGGVRQSGTSGECDVDGFRNERPGRGRALRVAEHVPSGACFPSATRSPSAWRT
jgi:hypothetical protein